MQVLGEGGGLIGGERSHSIPCRDHPDWVSKHALPNLFGIPDKLLTVRALKPVCPTHPLPLKQFPKLFDFTAPQVPKLPLLDLLLGVPKELVGTIPRLGKGVNDALKQIIVVSKKTFRPKKNTSQLFIGLGTLCWRGL